MKEMLCLKIKLVLMTGMNLKIKFKIFLIHNENFRRQQYVGRPFDAQIDLVSNKLYLATDQNLLGAINIKTGSIGKRI